jgi:hypothetical protein
MKHIYSGEKSNFNNNFCFNEQTRINKIINQIAKGEDVSIYSQQEANKSMIDRPVKLLSSMFSYLTTKSNSDDEKKSDEDYSFIKNGPNIGINYSQEINAPINRDQSIESKYYKQYIKYKTKYMDLRNKLV